MLRNVQKHPNLKSLHLFHEAPPEFGACTGFVSRIFSNFTYSTVRSYSNESLPTRVVIIRKRDRTGRLRQFYYVGEDTSEFTVLEERKRDVENVIGRLLEDYNLQNVGEQRPASQDTILNMKEIAIKDEHFVIDEETDCLEAPS
mmetsp:Transcript_37868/g.43512  ORF Transcript_37868/g.43512 Transcript_37868/m.43512 type:complete len:144 (+) Transcript_37868:145-576(+)